MVGRQVAEVVADAPGRGMRAKGPSRQYAFLSS